MQCILAPTDRLGPTRPHGRLSGLSATNVIRKNADPKSEVAKVASKAKDEIKRVNG
jgi:hypothetical protein